MGYTPYLPAEHIVWHPWSEVKSFPKVREPSAPSEVLPEAHIRWGQPSEFEGDFRDRASDPNPPRFEEDEFRDLTFREEARTWTDLRVVNPEDDEQFFIARAIDSIAFTLPDSGFRTRGFYDPENNRLGFRRGRQQVFTFSNGYDAQSIPSYLRNSEGVPFEPIVLDPFTSIVEVGWPPGDFVLISVLVKPRMSCEFAMQLDNPPDTGIYTPGYEYGELPPDDPNTGDVDESQPPAGALPFMERMLQNTVFDQDRETPGSDLEPQGMGPPLQRFGPDGPENVGGSNDTGESNYQVGPNLLRLRIFTEREHWGLHHPSPVPMGPGGNETIWRKSSEGPLPGYWLIGLGMKFLGYKEGGSVAHHIPNYLEDGEEYTLNEGEASEVKEQWRLDNEVENYTQTGDGPSEGGFVMGEDSLGTPYRAYAFYRRWAGEAPKPYDNNPFVVALFMVDVSVLRKAFINQIAGTANDDLLISVLAGAAGDVRTEQGLEDDEGDFAPQSGKIRWAWYRGNDREAVMNHISALSDEGGVFENLAENPPTEDEVWEALFPQDGLRTFNEEPFPSGLAIEGELKIQKTYAVRYAERELVERT